MHLVRFTLEIYYDAGPYERQICTVCVCVCVCAYVRRVHKVIINRKKLFIISIYVRVSLGKRMFKMKCILKFTTL